MARFEIGRFACAVIEVGPVGPYQATDLCVNATPDEAADLLGGTEIMTGLNSLLVRDGERVILVDTGMGMFMPEGSARLRERLAAEDVAPEDVTMVLTSHAHPDHIGGHVVDGKPTFPHATYLFSKVEWDHFVGGTGVEMFDQAAQAVLPTLEAAGLVEWMGSGEILPGIEVVEAPGHTPGHVAFGIFDSGKRGLYLADSFLYPRHLERPELYSAFDWNGPQSAQSRVKLVERAATERATLVVYHLDAPGIGRVDKVADAYRWVSGLP